MASNNVNIDFSFYEDYDVKTLIVIDTSCWSYISDEPAIIEITKPGSSTPIVNWFAKESVTIFNSISLSGECYDCGDNETYDLPDGMYEVTVKGSPDTFCKTKTYLRTARLRRDMDNLLTKGTGCNKAIEVDEFMQMEFLLRSSEAHIRSGKIQCGMDIYRKLRSKVDSKLNC